jgi:hypothetical protein
MAILCGQGLGLDLFWTVLVVLPLMSVLLITEELHRGGAS